MPVTKQILKIVRGQAVVKLIGTAGGSNTVTLQELTKSDEVWAGQANSTVTIAGVFNSIDAMVSISRAGANVLVLAANQQDKWDFNQSWGFTLNDNASANVDVNFTGNGSVILVLNKVKGYIPPNRQNHID